MNGIDVLFLFAGLVLLFIVWHYGAKFSEWSEWDRDRRRQRTYDRIMLNDLLAEKRYRKNLRLIFQLKTFTNAMVRIQVNCTEATRVFATLADKMKLIANKT